MTLYEIDTRLTQLADSVIDPETGEFIGDVDAWQDLQMARDQKIENTGLYAKNLKAEIKALKAEEETFSKRRKRLENRLKWCEYSLSSSLCGEQYESPRLSIRFKKNQPSVVYTDEEETMKWAMEHRQDLITYDEPRLSKSGIKELLKSGEQVPGAELVQKTRMEVI